MMRHAANKSVPPALGIFSPLRYAVFRRISRKTAENNEHSHFRPRTDCWRSRVKPVPCASFESHDKNAPSKPGTKHFNSLDAQREASEAYVKSRVLAVAILHTAMDRL
jgi:hypothetical protein